MNQPLTVGDSVDVQGTPLVTLSVDRQKRVDEFFRMMVPTYRTPSGAAIAATSFFMLPGWPVQQPFMHDAQKQAALQRAAVAAGVPAAHWINVWSGRGAPSEIKAVTQVLIDQEPSVTSWDPEAVRKVQFEHAIGIDCAGYVQQAYLYVTQRTRAQANFQPRVIDDDLSGLGQRGYVCVSKRAPDRVIPGDIVVFVPPNPREVGHRTIVFDQRVATADDEAFLRAMRGGPKFIEDKPADVPLRILQLDSSWGGHGDYRLGGVQRRQFAWNGLQWGILSLENPDAYRLTESRELYVDQLDGFYRLRGD